MPTNEMIKSEVTGSLQQMLFIKNSILDNIYDNYGEISNDEDLNLLQLDVTIPAKVDGWAWTLMKDGGIDKEIEILTERKKAFEDIIHKLKLAKERLKIRLNDILRHYELERIDGNNFWIKRDVSTSSRVIMDKVEDEYKTYELPKLSGEEYRKLIKLLENYSKDLTLFNLLDKFSNDKTESCGVKSLPTGHSAIEVSLAPTVRIYQIKKSPF